jgi:hypothetical protein
LTKINFCESFFVDHALRHISGTAMQISSKQVSHYLCSPLRTLYAVCREAGRDDHGRACPACPVREICIAERKRADLAQAD